MSFITKPKAVRMLRSLDGYHLDVFMCLFVMQTANFSIIYDIRLTLLRTCCIMRILRIWYVFYEYKVTCWLLQPYMIHDDTWARDYPGNFITKRTWHMADYPRHSVSLNIHSICKRESWYISIVIIKAMLHIRGRLNTSRHLGKFLLAWPKA